VVVVAFDELCVGSLPVREAVEIVLSLSDESVCELKSPSNDIDSPRWCSKVLPPSSSSKFITDIDESSFRRCFNMLLLPFSSWRTFLLRCFLLRLILFAAERCCISTLRGRLVLETMQHAATATASAIIFSPLVMAIVVIGYLY
jgi:hypothetical protein